MDVTQQTRKNIFKKIELLDFLIDSSTNKKQVLKNVVWSRCAESLHSVARSKQPSERTIIKGLIPSTAEDNKSLELENQRHESRKRLLFHKLRGSRGKLHVVKH